MGTATATLLLSLLAAKEVDGPAAAGSPPWAVARIDTKEPVVALTFDACATLDQPNAFDRQVFDILKRENVPATVFVSGRWIESHPDVARELAANAFIEFGNHSYSHPTLTAVPADRLADEIARTEDLIAQLGRRSVAFRPPAGVFDQRTLKMAADRKLPTVLWDVVSRDVGGHIKPELIVEGVTRDIRPGSIVIFHINGRGNYTKDVLPQIIRILRERGMGFLPLSRLLALPNARLLPARRIMVRKQKDARPAG
jgi:peptidoglycan/xylan/chitin deacetylase (PgdA/CDA1 family)